MGRHKGSYTGKGHELARRWAEVFGSQPMLAKEAVGIGEPFGEYSSIQAVTRVLANAGYTLKSEPYDNRSHVYSLAPNVVEQLLSEEQ